MDDHHLCASLAQPDGGVARVSDAGFSLSDRQYPLVTETRPARLTCPIVLGELSSAGQRCSQFRQLRYRIVPRQIAVPFPKYPASTGNCV